MARLSETTAPSGVRSVGTVRAGARGASCSATVPVLKSTRRAETDGGAPERLVAAAAIVVLLLGYELWR